MRTITRLAVAGPVIFAAGISLAACQSSGSQSQAPAPTVTKTVTMTPGQELRAWWTVGGAVIDNGTMQTQHVNDGSNSVSQDILLMKLDAKSGGSLSDGAQGLATDSTQLARDVSTAQAHMPPVSAPKVLKSYTTAMADDAQLAGIGQQIAGSIQAGHGMPANLVAQADSLSSAAYAIVGPLTDTLDHQYPS